MTAYRMMSAAFPILCQVYYMPFSLSRKAIFQTLSAIFHKLVLSIPELIRNVIFVFVGLATKILLAKILMHCVPEIYLSLLHIGIRLTVRVTR